MESDSWSRFSAASRRHQSTLQSRFDLYLGFDDVEGGEDDFRAEFGCPFCAEDFDIVGLCCHIDEEHPVEAKNGVCPVCAARVGMDMVGHITTQHGNFFKMQRRRRFRRGSSASQSTLSLLRKELREGNLQSLFGGSSYLSPPSSAAPDPLLSSFITNLPVADPPRESQTLDDRNMDSEASEDKPIESNQPILSDKDQEERARRSKFAQGLVLSTIFDDIL
ncbi:protein DEHYDRATION-INDUCED 19 homolog 2-like [Asparagus officinalis]|uniref:protein DEHYDRATION-INDUCED 19 homolog 2-like n=1 Tax=Asparagus officinalis TaxID=4686 RepID=UPI00098E8295|nr:protein DEHYDRATION-INDUCED 19 homolog 2-like [Asparagus officinalis]